MSRRVVVSDDDEEMGLMSESKLHGKTNYEYLKLKDMERFIHKFYWMVILMFFAIGVVMVTVLSERSFEEIFMAESLLGSVGVTGYVVLLLLLLMCHSHREMRIIILLGLCLFIGMVGGFLMALHLLNVTITLKKNT